MKRVVGLLVFACVPVLLTACGTPAAPKPPAAPKAPTAPQSLPAIAAGAFHSLALKSDGSVWAWGYNGEGELGNGATLPGANSSAPVQVVGPSGTGTLSGVTAIAAGDYHSLALKGGGSVWAWGNNGYGQLGDGSSGTGADSSAPVQVVGPTGTGSLSGVTAIAAGTDFSLALESDGSVWAWGYNFHGELGNGSSGTISSTPVQVVAPAGSSGTLLGVTAIAAGTYHSLALKSDGSVWAWGNNSTGQLGNGTSNGFSSTPVQVVAPAGSTGTLSGVTAIAAGGSFSLALKSDGSVWAWGYNFNGQLGDGSNGTSPTPVQVVGPSATGSLSGVTAIAAGGSFSLALESDGSVWAWGYNFHGELGNGSSGTTYNGTPVQVVGPGGGTTVTLTGITAIDAGKSHSLALKSDDSVWAWGRNNTGQLGNGSSGPGTISSTPVQVGSLFLNALGGVSLQPVTP